MATTELQSTLSAAQTDIPYGSIATYDGTTITDGSVLALSIDGVVQVLDTDYTVDTVNQDLVLTTPATGGELAVVTRVTDGDDPYVDFTNNTVVDANDLDLALKQLLFLIQETVTSIGDFLSYSSLNAYWDGENRTTSNFMPAATSTGLPTLSQVQDLIAGVSTASIDNVTVWNFEPSTPTTAFSLTNAKQGLSDAKELFVWINGVRQRPDVGYTLDTSGNTPIVTTASLTSGDLLEVVQVSGTVSTTFADGSIDSDALADLAVTAAKISVGSGVDKRVLVSNTSGAMTARVLTHADVSDFDTGVRENRVTQLLPPGTNLNMNGHGITSLVANSADGTSAVNVAQMNAAISSALGGVTSASYFVTSLANGATSTVDVGFDPDGIRFSRESGGGTVTHTGALTTSPSNISNEVAGLVFSKSGTSVVITNTTGVTISNIVVDAVQNG